MSYIVQASPLSKLFMREFQSVCEEDPHKVFDQTPFKVTIPRATGAIILTHLKPVMTSKLLPKRENIAKPDENNQGELEALVEWLTGGSDGMRSSETDIYGVVNLNIDLDLGASIVHLASLQGDESEAERKDAEKEFKELQQKLKTRSKTALKEAQELADKRVRRALKNTHMNLMKQYETLKSEGKGVYTPSVAEAVGAFILSSELEKYSANRRRMVETLANVAHSTSILS